MKKLLVLGGAGFIGSNFIRYWLGKYNDFIVVNFDKLTYAGNLENLIDIQEKYGVKTEDCGQYYFTKGDIVDFKCLRQVFNEFRPNFVINFAAETHVDRSIHEGAGVFAKTNIEGVLNILELVREYKIGKFLQVSTDEVYGDLPLDRPDLKFKEDSLLNPKNPYSASKASADLICFSYFHTHKVPVVVTRCSNNFGPYQYPEKLIPSFIVKLRENEKVPVYGTGENIRDWIYVGDHCSALDICLLNGRVGEIYNVGASNEISNIELAKMIISYFNTYPKNFVKTAEDYMKFVADRPGHDLRYAIDASKIQNELKWRPLVKKANFKQKLSEVIDWYMDNEIWMDKTKEGTEINKHIK